MKTAILVANAAGARLFATSGPLGRAQLVLEKAHIAGRKRGHELVTSPPGSVTSRQGIHGGKAPRRSPKDVELQHFAEEIAHLLNKERAKQSYARLILVAPARFLGALHKHLDDTTKKRVTKTVAKDLAYLKNHELVSHLERFW